MCCCFSNADLACAYSHTLSDDTGVKRAVKEGQISLRQAAIKYGIPKSTLSDYHTGKVEVGGHLRC